MNKILLSVCFLAFACTSVTARHPRVLNGKDAKAGDVKDYVTIYTFFEQQWQICGGVYYADKWVLTTKSCVNE